jgi:hypothetical protein
VKPFAERYGWTSATPIANIRSLDEAVRAARELNPALHEGFVVVDANYNRVKIKSPQYVALSGISLRDAGRTNKRRMIQIVRTNECTFAPLWHTCSKRRFAEALKHQSS